MEDHREPKRALKVVPGMKEGEENQQKSGWMTWNII
jgi:hypothetical protein